jgi:pimeloyl-ACP methyl ester carboxylesterase
MTDFVMSSDGVRIAYDDVGAGAPVLLVHGFASGRIQNWKEPGWYKTLAEAGYRVIAFDCRGHGESGKPRDPKMYGHDIMARDAVTVMDAAGVKQAFVMGYSMGGSIGMHLLLGHAARVTALVVGGVGGSYLDPSLGDMAIVDPARREEIAAGLLAENKSSIADPIAKAFRAFAEQPGKDRAALAACMRADRKPLAAGELAKAARPVLVVCGEKDLLTGPPGPLAAAFPQGRAVTVPGRDHMTTVGDKVYKQAVLEFLKEQP